jgi:hypothetical protein
MVDALTRDQAAVLPQDGAGGDQPVHSQPCRQEPDEHGEDGVVGLVEPGPGMRRSTATSCGSTSSSASLEDDDRPSRTSQPQSRDEDEVEQAQGHG